MSFELEGLYNYKKIFLDYKDLNEDQIEQIYIKIFTSSRQFCRIVLSFLVKHVNRVVFSKC